MITENFEAWLLHKQWKGESSAYVSFFSAEQGIIQCLAKGAKLSKKNAALQAFTPLWVSISEKAGWKYLNQVEPASPTLELHSRSLFSALYLNELLFRFIRTNDSHPLLFSVYVQSLTILQDNPSQSVLEQTLRKFERALLTCCGYHLDLSHDTSGKPLVADTYYSYKPGEGFYSSQQGMLGEHLLLFAESRMDDPLVLKIAKYIMRKTIHHALEGKPLKSRDFFATL